MFNQSISQINELLNQKKMSCVELTQDCIARIKKQDAQLNCFITLCEQSALDQAKQADARRQADNHTMLTGIPVAQKDNLCTQGVLTTCGSKMLETFTPPYNATLVSKINAAGAIMIGKLNMDEFAMGSTTANSFFGKTRNPWDLTRTPGGSSGGSAAAVAARLVPLATGTDTGGSIRQPAALCGLTGLKPTYGRVSRWGVIAFASSLDQAGPIGKSAEDVAHLFECMAGHDPKDSTSIRHPVDAVETLLKPSQKSIRIGIPEEYFSKISDPGIVKALEEKIQYLKNQGHQITSISLPHTQYAKPTYYTIAPAECSTNLARFDGIRYGHRCSDPASLKDLYQRSRSEGFGNEVKRRILIGTHVLSSGYYDAYYKKAQQVRRLIRDDFITAFKNVDLILTPTTPTTAFQFDNPNNAPVSLYNSDIFTLSVNLAGLPACSFPIGMENGLPIGAQLIAPHFAEAEILSLVHQYQQTTNWHQLPPLNTTNKKIRASSCNTTWLLV